MIDAKSLFKGNKNISPALLERLVSAKTAILTPLKDKALMQIADKAVEELNETLPERVCMPFNMSEILVESLAKDCSARSIQPALATFISECESYVYGKGHLNAQQIQIERKISVNWDEVGLLIPNEFEREVIKNSDIFTSCIVNVDDQETVSNRAVLVLDLSYFEPEGWDTWLTENVSASHTVVGFVRKPQAAAYKRLRHKGVKVVAYKSYMTRELIHRLCISAYHRMKVINAISDRKRRFIKATHHKAIKVKCEQVQVQLSEPELETTFDPNDFDVPFMQLHQPRFDFEAVLGNESVKNYLSKIKDQFTCSTNVDLDLPRGIILAGPPGTGKTMNAEALAGEMKLPFVSINSADIVAQGNAVSNIKKLFQVIEKISPCLVFFDEFDSLGRARTETNASHSLAVNTLLAEMDGVTSGRARSLFLAATNFDNVLDPALLRAGRFEKSIVFSLPDEKAREYAIGQFAEKYNYMLNHSEMSALSKITAEKTYKSIENIFRDAELINAEGERNYRKLLSIAVGINGIYSTPGDPNVIKSRAIHEAGHFICMRHNNPDIHIPFLSAKYNPIEPDTSALPGIVSKKSLHCVLVSILGGYACESEILGEENVSASCFGDIKRATYIAKNVLVKLGAFEGFEGIDTTQLRSFEAYVDKQTSQTVDDALRDAKRIIKENKSTVLQLSGLLNQHEYLLTDDLKKFEINTSIRGEVIGLH